MLSQACALAQNRHGLQFTHTRSVDVYVGQANMSCVASPNSCVLHVFEDATSEGSNEPVHWHILTRLQCMHTPSEEVYVGQTIMRWLHVASSNGCLMHAFEVATNESTDEPAHWHSLTRAHTLCINKVWKYIHVRPALLDGYVRNVF